MSTSSRCPQGAEVLSPFHPQVKSVRNLAMGSTMDILKFSQGFCIKRCDCKMLMTLKMHFHGGDGIMVGIVHTQLNCRRLLAFSLCCSQAFPVSGSVDVRNWLCFTCSVAAEDLSPIPVIRSPVIRSCFTRKAKNIRLPCLRICGQSFIALPNTRNPATVYGSSGWEAQKELYWHIGIPREHVFL